MEPAVESVQPSMSDQAIGEADAVASMEVSCAAEQFAEAEVEDVVKVYFVRIPRPPLDETERQRLQQEFQASLSDLKSINARLAAKREVVRNLRSQMQAAKSLKGSAQPEFEEKLNHLKQLRDIRQSCIADIINIKNMVKGLECRTEQELDAKIKQEEDKIRFGSASLREEKMIVNEISKLRSQREKIKEYELERSRLAELEADTAKVKATIEELESEFSIIKGERDEASKVMGGFYDQLKAAEKEASKVEEEQKDAVDKKNEAHQALEAAKLEVDATMQDYRDNRKFSLQVRDMMAAGEVEAARELCTAQTDTMMDRLLSDSSFWSEYCQIMAEQRRFPVSELLPESSAAAAAANAAAKQSGKAGNKSAASAPVKLVPRGKEKAAELIASIMQSASVEAATRKAAAPPPPEDDYADAREVTEVVKPVAPPKRVENAGAKAAEVFNFKVELPHIEDVEFVPPVLKSEVSQLSKDQIREEQRLKAQEAEQRKKKRQETVDKKRARAIELQKKADEAERMEKTKPAHQMHEPKAPVPEAVAEPTIQERAVPKEISTVPSKHVATGSLALKPGVAAKRPASKANVLRKLKKFYQNNSTVILLAAVFALIVGILILASFY